MKLEDPLLPGLPDLGSDFFLLLMERADVKVKVLLEVKGDVLRHKLYVSLDLHYGLLCKERPQCVFDVDLHRKIDLGVESLGLDGATLCRDCRDQKGGNVGKEAEAGGESRHDGRLWL